ncbi:TfoX/Sxy family protein [Inquilinus limosus]|uniref:TfoX/Sxy family protein n=1 Tax=Inquilinus limosus TaxID=171674 RepID=UPI003F190030
MRERPISDLPNLGPKTAEWLAAVGITTEAELRAVGPIAAWQRLKAAQPEVITVNALYALHGALTNQHWASLPQELRALLRRDAGVE